ncbi:hypothetical protein JET68_05200 [Pseudomonas monteilii]|uniref:hypothetical protein n=1 Tax=Pseudomonas putida group TaxID=136845 RepID=UPI00125DB79E|nr:MULTISPECIES: hypothetical protein [Pseudomonas putida group]MBI6918189.1 hypothetical protein [Pseudomonas monteilii]
MFTLDSLPSNYRPYDKLNLCGTQLIGGTQLFAIGGKLPLIVGSGAKPQIWLHGITSQDGRRSTLLVDSSIPKFSWVRVMEQGRQVVVKVNDATILKIEQTGIDQAVISEIDLRSIGFSIHGNVSTLFIAGSQFSGGTVVGSKVFAGFEG